MTTPIDYRITLTFDSLRVRADLAQASTPILLIDEDGEAHHTGLQTADARHRVRDMAKLVVLSLGRDYWLDPSIDAEISHADAAKCVERLIVSVTEM